MAVTKQKVATLQELKARRFALATLPTGMTVRLRSVTLDELAAEDGLSEELIRVAVLEQLPGGVVGEMARESLNDTGRMQTLLRESNSLRDMLVLASVVDPILSADDLPDLDPFDKDMIANLAKREIDYDAAGRRVWGIEPLNTFQTFREEHGCAEDCPSCGKIIERFSQVQ